MTLWTIMSKETYYVDASGCQIRNLLRIPIEAGQGFRREAGHYSGLKPATSPM